MMKSPSKHNHSSAPLFLDTSVVINLVAADCLPEVACAMERPLVVTEYVVGEFVRDPRDGSDGQTVIKNYIAKKVLVLHTMTAEQTERFVELVGATPPDDLGDGEASTLACAQGHDAAIDERKARRIATRDFPNTGIYLTLDLLTSPPVVAKLGLPRVAALIDRARVIGRMRIAPEWRDWVDATLAKYLPAEAPAAIKMTAPDGLDGAPAHSTRPPD
jgi:predicted nucleic acid-binding protein